MKTQDQPANCAKAYCAAGADELAILDITATVENRATMLDVVKRVAAVTTIPFTVGGGIKDASVFHFGIIAIPELKKYLRSCGFSYRLSQFP